MNKTVIGTCMVIGLFSINAGISMGNKAQEISRQKENMLIQNDRIKEEMAEKRSLIPQPPVDLSKAFSLVINEMRFLEMYSGTSMNLTIEKTNGNDAISNYYVGSQYHGVRKLPVLIQVDKFSNETDMGAVLNDIYQLEVQTDFKVTQINKDGNVLTVKGDIYGL